MYRTISISVAAAFVTFWLSLAASAETPCPCNNGCCTVSSELRNYGIDLLGLAHNPSNTDATHDLPHYADVKMIEDQPTPNHLIDFKVQYGYCGQTPELAFMVENGLAGTPWYAPEDIDLAFDEDGTAAIAVIVGDVTGSGVSGAYQWLYFLRRAPDGTWNPSAHNPGGSEFIVEFEGGVHNSEDAVKILMDGHNPRILVFYDVAVVGGGAGRLDLWICDGDCTPGSANAWTRLNVWSGSADTNVISSDFAVAANGDIHIVWSAVVNQVGPSKTLWYTSWSPISGLGAQTTIESSSPSGGPTAAKIAVDSAGQPRIAYEMHVNGSNRIFYRSRSAGQWGDPIDVVTDYTSFQNLSLYDFELRSGNTPVLIVDALPSGSTRHYSLLFYSGPNPWSRCSLGNAGGAWQGSLSISPLTTKRYVAQNRENIGNRILTCGQADPSSRKGVAAADLWLAAIIIAFLSVSTKNRSRRLRSR